MKELVEIIAKALVGHPEEVVVTEEEKDGETVVTLKVAASDMGKVIGKQGRIARAIRAVVKAASAKTSTHGLKGEVNIYPVTDNVSRFDALKEILLEREGGFDSVQVEHVRYFKNRPILKMKGYDRIEDVEHLKGQSIYVRRSDAVALEENEYFIGDLIGLDVVLEDGSRFGTLADVLRTGANDVYAVKKDDGSIVYLPAIKEVILHTDPEAGIMTVRPMKEI